MPFNIPTQREYAIDMVLNATRQSGPTGELAIAQALIYIGDVIKATSGYEGDVEAVLRAIAIDITAIREANAPPPPAAA